VWYFEETKSCSVEAAAQKRVAYLISTTKVHLPSTGVHRCASGRARAPFLEVVGLLCTVVALAVSWLYVCVCLCLWGVVVVVVGGDTKSPLRAKRNAE